MTASLNPENKNSTSINSSLKKEVISQSTNAIPEGKRDGKKEKKLVDITGLVTHNLSNGKFRVKLENGVQVIAYLSGKIRKNRIKIVVGDTVTVELSPYDLTKGRIIYRHRESTFS